MQQRDKQNEKFKINLKDKLQDDRDINEMSAVKTRVRKGTLTPRL